jgi:hypothetical protein
MEGPEGTVKRPKNKRPPNKKVLAGLARWMERNYSKTRAVN